MHELRSNKDIYTYIDIHQFGYIDDRYDIDVRVEKKKIYIQVLSFSLIFVIK